MDEPLTGQGGTVFNSKRGQRLDWPWAIAYLSCLAFAIVGGIWTAFHRNADFFNAIDPVYMDNGRHCPAPGLGGLLQQQQHAEAFDIGDFARNAGTWLAASAAGSLLVGLAFLQLFKHASTAATYATIAFQICVPLIAGVGGLSVGAYGPGGFALLMAGIGALTFYLWREQLALCAKLLALSASALTENPGLIGFVVVTQIVNAILTIGLLVLTLMAYEHGAIVQNSGVRRGADHMCVDEDEQHTACCMWQPTGWSKAYMSISALTVLWTLLLFGQMRTFVTAGTVAQWYFSPPNARSIKGTTRRMVGYALGQQFGTLCFAAAVLVVVQLIRSAAQEARNRSRDGDGNILMSMLACALECIASVIEFLTKFALIFSAIIGVPLVDAGRKAVDMLRRNMLNTIGVWWLPPMIVQLAAFTLSIVWGLGLYAVAHVSWSSRVNVNMEAGLLGFLAGGMALVVLSFCGGILLDIVDALYVCYATDRDQSEVTKAEVHDVFSQLPVGAVIEQPDGTRLYGSPADNQSRVSYVAPNEQQRQQQGTV